MDYETSTILTRTQIRLISNLFRKMFKIRTIAFPVLKVLDLLVDKFENNLYYDIQEDEKFAKYVMAELVVEDKEKFCIRIRQSVFDKALEGDRASIGYVCHEMCHFFLIYIIGIGPKKYVKADNLVYAKTIDEKITPAYKSMEWQAKALCGEVMIPYEKCKNYSLEEIIYRTRSSTEQAKYFLNTVAKEGLNKSEK